MEFGEILEIIVLAAIAKKLFALYNHTKLHNRIGDHILEVDERIAKSDSLTNVLDDHISRFDEHMNRLNENMIRTQEHMIRTNRLMERLDEHIIEARAL